MDGGGLAATMPVHDCAGLYGKMRIAPVNGARNQCCFGAIDLLCVRDWCELWVSDAIKQCDP
jgi:hypothetical protein